MSLTPEQCEQFWTYADADGDGSLTIHELKAGLHKFLAEKNQGGEVKSIPDSVIVANISCPMPQDPRKPQETAQWIAFRDLYKMMSAEARSQHEIFTDLDKDGNKSISKEEFLQEMMLPHRRETLKAEFMKLCNPVTRKMGRAEVAKMCQATKTYSDEDIEKILQAVDINGDGQIDLDEFLAACS